MDQNGSNNNRVVKYIGPLKQESWGLITQRKETSLLITELLEPRKCKGKLQSDEYTGERELYKSWRVREVPHAEVLDLVPEHSLESYQGGSGFLIRRSVTSSESFKEPLPEVCLCKLRLNPDIPYSICQLCSTVYHNNCLTDVHMCPQCGHPFKRLREETEPSSPMKLARNESTGSRSGSSLPIDVDKYKSLSEHSKNIIHEKAIKINNELLGMLSSLSDADKPRQQLIAKLMCALFLAQEENNITITEREIKYLAMEIESSIFISSKSRAVSNEYKRKVRSLGFNLLDEKNTDFRGDILKREIKAADIVKMESRDMASGAVKNFRQERQKIYAQEQLVLPSNEEKVLIKTHKGDVVLDVNQEVRPEPDNDDPFNPDSYLDDQPDNLTAKTKEWMPAAIQERLTRRLEQYLPQEADRLISQINMINSKS